MSSSTSCDRGINLDTAITILNNQSSIPAWNRVNKILGHLTPLQELVLNNINDDVNEEVPYIKDSILTEISYYKNPYYSAGDFKCRLTDKETELDLTYEIMDNTESRDHQVWLKVSGKWGNELQRGYSGDLMTARYTLGTGESQEYVIYIQSSMNSNKYLRTMISRRMLTTQTDKKILVKSSTPSLIPDISVDWHYNEEYSFNWLIKSKTENINIRLGILNHSGHTSKPSISGHWNNDTSITGSFMYDESQYDDDLQIYTGIYHPTCKNAVIILQSTTLSDRWLRIVIPDEQMTSLINNHLWKNKPKMPQGVLDDGSGNINI